MSRWQKIIGVGMAVPALILAFAIIWPMVARDEAGNVRAFPGFGLAQPILALTAAEFPDPSVGMSVYIQIATPTLDLDGPTKSPFTQVTYGGDNFVIGMFREARVIISVGVRDSFIDVSVYLDNQGWIMAYLPSDVLTVETIVDDRPSPDMIMILERALDRVVTAAGVSGGIDGLEDQVGYYHWAYPSATHLALARKDDAGNLYFAVPETATLFELSVAKDCFSTASFGPFGASAVSCSSFEVVSFPLMDGIPLGRKLNRQGNILLSSIARPPDIGAAGPTKGQVQSIPSQPNWIGAAIVYQMPAP